MQNNVTSLQFIRQSSCTQKYLKKNKHGKNGGYLVDPMYVSRDVPIVKSTWAQGTSKHKLTSLVWNFAKTSPIPWTFFTVLAALTGYFWIRDSKQRRTFPLAKVAFRESATQLLLKEYMVHTIFCVDKILAEGISPCIIFICISRHDVFSIHNGIELVKILIHIQCLTLWKVKKISMLTLKTKA